MLADVAFVVAGLSSGHKIGLAVVGAAFIVFALISSFVLPRRSPNFPGKNMGLYVTACVLFFLAMLAAVLVFGREKPEAKGSEPPAATATAQTTTAQTTTAQATTAPTSTAQAPTTTGGGSGAAGDPVAGKAVFTSAGCSGCHTLKDAGATGNVGPNLDQLKPTEAAVLHQVINGGGPMPAYKGQLSEAQIKNVSAYVFSATHS